MALQASRWWRADAWAQEAHCGLGAGGTWCLGHMVRHGGMRGWHEVLGGVGKGATAVSLRWRAVAGVAEELRRRWLGLGEMRGKGVRPDWIK